MDKEKAAFLAAFFYYLVAASIMIKIGNSIIAINNHILLIASFFSILNLHVFDKVFIKAIYRLAGVIE